MSKKKKKIEEKIKKNGKCYFKIYMFICVLLIYLNQILRSEIVELKAMDNLYMTLSKG